MEELPPGPIGNYWEGRETHGADIAYNTEPWPTEREGNILRQLYRWLNSNNRENYTNELRQLSNNQWILSGNAMQCMLFKTILKNS